MIKTSITPADLKKFAQIGINTELLERAGIRRVTDEQARQEFGVKGSGNNAGIVFPYLDAKGIRRT